MLSSLLIKLGMFAATMGVIFWIGWTLPSSFDRTRDLAGDSSGEAQAELASTDDSASSVSPSPSGLVPDRRQPTEVAQKRFAKGRLDLNRATMQDLHTLPGIGPKLAERIMKHRQLVGAFHSPDDLRGVKGIGKKTFERIRPLVTVTPIDQSVDGARHAT